LRVGFLLSMRVFQRHQAHPSGLRRRRLFPGDPGRIWRPSDLVARGLWPLPLSCSRNVSHDRDPARGRV